MTPPTPPPSSSSSWDAAQAALAALPSSKRTMLGVPSPSGGLEVGGQAVPAPPPAAVPMPAPAPMPPGGMPAYQAPAMPKVEVSAAAFGELPSARPARSPLASTQIDRESYAGAPRRSRAGLVAAIVVGVLAVIGIVVVLAFREELFGGSEAPAKAADGGAAVATPGTATLPGTPAAPPAPPPQIAVKLVWSGDGSSVELEFGQIVSQRPVLEIRLAAGPKAGTPDAVVKPGTKVPLSDFLEAGAEPAPGTLKIPLDVAFGDGTTQRIENTLTVPYTFRATVDAAAAEPTVVLAFRLANPEGRTLQVAGADVAVAADGTAAWRSTVDALRGKEGVFAEKATRIDLTLPFVVRDATGVVAEGTATTSVPVVPLRIDFPGDGGRTTDESVWVRGETAPGASLALDGAAVTVADNGAFAVEVPLAAGAERTLELRASRAGAAARVATVAVTRTTAAELARAADEWAAGLTERLGFSDFAGAADSFRGRKVDLLGRISSVPATREGVSSFVLYVDTGSGCPAAEVCAVMVHVPTAQTLSERDQVRVLGEVQGRERTTSEKFPELPAVRAALVVPQ
ncbi:MAG: hypothetical protein JXB32_06595 [Deltaproteobacteria bacterium]|nr:hypothetical protein [Deltaproteobacteria bacterium]